MKMHAIQNAEKINGKTAIVGGIVLYTQCHGIIGLSSQDYNSGTTLIQTPLGSPGIQVARLARCPGY